MFLNYTSRDVIWISIVSSLAGLYARDDELSEMLEIPEYLYGDAIE